MRGLEGWVVQVIVPGLEEEDDEGDKVGIVRVKRWFGDCVVVILASSSSFVLL